MRSSAYDAGSAWTVLLCMTRKGSQVRVLYGPPAQEGFSARRATEIRQLEQLLEQFRSAAVQAPSALTSCLGESQLAVGVESDRLGARLGPLVWHGDFKTKVHGFAETASQRLRLSARFERQADRQSLKPRPRTELAYRRALPGKSGDSLLRAGVVLHEMEGQWHHVRSGEHLWADGCHEHPDICSLKVSQLDTD